jgi:hypothetical protein
MNRGRVPWYYCHKWAYCRVPDNMMDERMKNWWSKWQGKTKVLKEKPAPVPLHSPQIPCPGTELESVCRPCLLRNPMINYHVHNSLALDLIPSMMNPGHILIPCFFNSGVFKLCDTMTPKIIHTFTWLPCPFPTPPRTSLQEVQFCTLLQVCSRMHGDSRNINSFTIFLHLQ